MRMGLHRYYRTWEFIIGGRITMRVRSNILIAPLTIVEKTGNRKRIAGNLINVGGIYARQKEFDKAMDYLERGSSIAEAVGDKVFIPMEAWPNVWNRTTARTSERSSRTWNERLCGKDRDRG